MLSKTPNPAKKHHFLPEFYLRHFADKDEEIWEIRRTPRGDLREKPTGPGGLGHAPNLYAVHRESALYDPPIIDSIETTFFREIDNDAAPVMKRLVVEPPSILSATERAKWSRFVSSLTERHPQKLRENDLRALSLAGDVATRVVDRGPEETRERRREALELLEPGVVTNLVRTIMVRAIDDPSFLAHLDRLTWARFDATNAPILTGDHAVVSNAGKPWPIEFLTLALTPSALLIMHPFTTLDLEDCDALVRMHNEQILKQCEYVYSNKPLEDGEVEGYRTMALQELKIVSW